MSLTVLHRKQSPFSDLKLRCYTCLSLGRNLKPLETLEKKLLAMLCPEMFIDVKFKDQFPICWECESMIAKVKWFQVRLTKAHVKLKLNLKGVETMVESLSNLKITGIETIDIPSQAVQAPEVTEKSQSPPTVEVISQPPYRPTTPTPLKLEPEMITIKIEEVDKCFGDYDELQPSTTPQTDESTDTASETDMYDDPLMTTKQKKPNMIMKCSETEVLPQTDVKVEFITPNCTKDKPDKEFSNVPKESLTIRGHTEVVKVDVGVSNSVTCKVNKGKVPFVVKDEESVPIILRDTESFPISVKNKRSVSNMVKSKRKGTTRSKREVPFHNNPNPERESLPKEPDYDQFLGLYGYDGDDVKCVFLNMAELNIYRDKKRLKHGYKGTKYKCETCIEKFNCQKNLDEHNKKHQTARGSEICEVCEQRFYDRSVRDGHYKQHFMVFECLKCPYQNDDRLKISDHIRRCHQVSVFDCKKCDAVFKTYKEKRRHRIQVHSESQTCEECNSTFPSMSLLKTHMTIHQKEMVECPVCKKKVRKNYIDKHMKTHDDTREDGAYCFDCEKSFKSRKAYDKHLKSSLRHNTIEEIGIKCDHCDKYFSSKAALENHLEEIKGVRYTCDICKKDSKNKVLLARHILFVHKGQKPQLKPKICEYCGKSFTCKQGLTEHINSHLGLRPYVCKDCGATFSHKGVLFTHRRLVHKVKRTYEMKS